MLRLHSSRKDKSNHASKMGGGGLKSGQLDDDIVRMLRKTMLRFGSKHTEKCPCGSSLSWTYIRRPEAPLATYPTRNYGFCLPMSSLYRCTGSISSWQAADIFQMIELSLHLFRITASILHDPAWFAMPHNHAVQLYSPLSMNHRRGNRFSLTANKMVPSEYGNPDALWYLN